VAVGVGVVLLTNPVSAARSLAWLVGLALLVGGLLEIALAWSSTQRWLGLVLGGLLVLGGVLAVAWPDTTLWSLAVIAGVSLVAHGGARVAAAAVDRRQGPGRLGLFVAGVADVLIGLLALTWPGATILVLAVLLGIQVIVAGILLVVSAWLFGRPDVD